jgi:hypothetical protein
MAWRALPCLGRLCTTATARGAPCSPLAAAAASAGRAWPRAPAASFAAAAAAAPLPPPLLRAADEGTLRMMTSYSKWRVAASGHLQKEYEFRDVRTAERFIAQAADALLPYHLPAPLPMARAGPASPVLALTIDVDGGKGAPQAAGGPPRVITQRELDVALVVDDVAAELQLAGRWN